MAITIDIPNTLKEISFDEYRERIGQQHALTDPDSIMATAPLLKALAADKFLLVRHINEHLSDPASSDRNNNYSALSFIIGRGNGFTVRANLWPRHSSYTADNLSTKVSHNFDIPHNHNFELLTVGFAGVGYETIIHEVDETRIVGFPGEKVDLRFLEQTTLPEGKVMFYRRFKDVHIQLPPKELSISLNLLVRDDAGVSGSQYTFDFEKKTIIGELSGRVSDHNMMFEFAKHLGDENTGNHLIAIAEKHDNPLARLAAFDAAAQLIESSKVWRVALADKDAKIRRKAAEQLSA
jgi:hypothetical protein